MHKKGFYEQLTDIAVQGIIPVIVDMKRVSPKDGELLPEGAEAQSAQKLQNAGASVFSVVTEGRYFGGSLQMMDRIVRAVDGPVLRKDFITQEDDLKASIAYGASAVLLIAAQMEKKQLYYLYEKALDLGIEPLVEIHNQEELTHALALSPKVLGINNKNIGVLEKDDGTVNTSETLLPSIPSDVFTISESAIAVPDDVVRAAKAGAGAVLVGTAIWKAEHPERFYQSLCIRRP